MVGGHVRQVEVRPGLESTKNLLGGLEAPIFYRVGKMKKVVKRRGSLVEIPVVFLTKTWGTLTIRSSKA